MPIQIFGSFLFLLLLLISCIEKSTELSLKKNESAKTIDNIDEHDKLVFKKSLSGVYKPRVLSSIKFERDFITLDFNSQIEISLDKKNHLKFCLINKKNPEKMGTIHKIMFTETDPAQKIVFKSTKEAIFVSTYVFLRNKHVFHKDINIRIDKNSLYINDKFIGYK